MLLIEVKTFVKIKLYVRIIGGINYANVDPGPHSSNWNKSRTQQKLAIVFMIDDGLPEVAVRVDQTNTDLKSKPKYK